MIHAHSIISGFTVIQGNFAFHIPMLIAMMNLTLPGAESKENAFFRDVESSMVTKLFNVKWCFVLAGAMHVLLSILNISTIVTLIPEAYPALFKSV